MLSLQDCNLDLADASGNSIPWSRDMLDPQTGQAVSPAARASRARHTHLEDGEEPVGRSMSLGGHTCTKGRDRYGSRRFPPPSHAALMG